MSSTDQIVSQRAVAKDIGMQAAAWIERRDFEQWTETDEVALKAWLDESPAHRVAFFRLDFSWQRTARLAALCPPSSERVHVLKKQRVLPAITWVAAILVGVIALATGGTLLFLQMDKTNYSTTIGGREILTLKDGSQIELNTDTVLQVSKSGNQREVWLERGEAYFQVVHDSAYPFVVDLGKRRVTDIGTKFVIRRDDQQMRVAVIEGEVQLNRNDASDKSQSAVLTAGDVAFASASSLSVVKKPLSALKEELSWRNGVLVFNHTTLAEAAAEINRYSGKKLVIIDVAAGRVMIGGTFPINNVMAIAEAAQDSLGLRIEERGDEIVISR